MFYRLFSIHTKKIKVSYFIHLKIKIMDNHFKSFKIKNFKCFDELNLTNIGKFNFIVGDNNVGKTSLLEALLFTNDNNFNTLAARWSFVIQTIKGLKNITDTPLAYYVNRNKKGWDKNSQMTFEIELKEKVTKGIEYYDDIFQIKNIELLTFDKLIYEINFGDNFNNRVSLTIPKFITLKNKTPFNSRKVIKEKTSIPNGKDFRGVLYSLPYVYFHLGYGSDLIQKYAKIQFIDEKREFIIEALKTLSEDIFYLEPAAILQTENAIILRSKGQATMPLASFGDGTIKLFRILMEILEFSEQRLMIDEIDTGVHHSRLGQFLETTLKTAHTHNTQLFATTHSLECLEKLQQMLAKESNAFLRNEVRIIKLAQSKDKGILAYTYDYEQFEYALENDLEIR